MWALRGFYTMSPITWCAFCEFPADPNRNWAANEAPKCPECRSLLSPRVGEQRFRPSPVRRRRRM